MKRSLSSAFAGVVLVGATLALAGGDKPVTSLHLDPNGELNIFHGCMPTPRPPEAVTQKIKRRMMAEANLPWHRAKEFELDHIVPLCLGGDATASNNLQLQPWSEAARKDTMEELLCERVRRGVTSCKEAQDFFRNGTWKAVVGLPKLLP